MFPVLMKHLATNPQSKLADIWRATYPEKDRAQVFRALESLVKKGFLVKEDIYYSVSAQLPVKDPYERAKREKPLVALSPKLTNSDNLKFFAKGMVSKNQTIDKIVSFPPEDILMFLLAGTIGLYGKNNALDKLPWLNELKTYLKGEELARRIAEENSTRDNEEARDNASDFDPENEFL